jgi:hypothetical protein
MGDGGIALIDLLEALDKDRFDIAFRGTRAGCSSTPSILADGPVWRVLYSRWSSR